ncbi:MAG TPA: S8 family serine peptidase [Xanthobacteraceae bacterium]
MTIGVSNESRVGPLVVAVIDGPYDAGALSRVLAHTPVSLGSGTCNINPNRACDHGTFIVGMLGAREDALIPGLCPDCKLLHVPLFIDANSPSATVDDLAVAIRNAVAAGARLINLSLAILGTESEYHPGLAAALNVAEASGAVLLVAAGNQGRVAMGQLLSHPVAVPVVAVDASQRLLPESNFGPTISRRGVAALGRMPGYASGGGTNVMSGTSVATAVATGTLAQVWAMHPEVDGAELRAIVAGLGPRNGSRPPILNRDFILAALGQAVAVARMTARRVGAEMTNYVRLQGATTMTNGNGQPARTVVPEGAAGGCDCGAPGGVCTCDEAPSRISGFVYAIGTIEAEYPNIAIEREMQILAHDRGLPTKPTDDRNWQHAVLSKDKAATRYLARQLRWRLTIEDFPVFVLSPTDPRDFDELIEKLKRPKYDEPDPPSGKRKSKSHPIESPFPHAEDLDVVIGVMGPQTPDGIAVAVDQIFTIQPGHLAPHGLAHFAQLADNRGLTDEDRAYNFLTARYAPPLSHGGGFDLAGVSVTGSRLGAAAERIVRAIYAFRNTTTGVEKKYFVRVDVTHEFPIIVNPWQTYLERGDT